VGILERGEKSLNNSPVCADILLINFHELAKNFLHRVEEEEIDFVFPSSCPGGVLKNTGYSCRRLLKLKDQTAIGEKTWRTI